MSAGWQPIATAPKSTFTRQGEAKFVVASYVLGFCPDEAPDVPQECIVMMWWEPNVDGGAWFGEPGHRLHPTHWMPLPSPPP